MSDSVVLRLCVCVCVLSLSLMLGTVNCVIYLYISRARDITDDQNICSTELSKNLRGRGMTGKMRPKKHRASVS